MSGFNSMLFTIFGSLYAAVTMAAILLTIYLVIMAAGYISVSWMRSHRFVAFNEEDMPDGFRERRTHRDERRQDSRRNEDRRHEDRRRNFRYTSE